MVSLYFCPVDQYVDIYINSEELYAARKAIYTRQTGWYQIG